MLKARLPACIQKDHIPLLAILDEAGECNYVAFRKICNPWRQEKYVDRQMKRLSRKGFALFTNTKTIVITEARRALSQGGNSCV